MLILKVLKCVLGRNGMGKGERRRKDRNGRRKKKEEMKRWGKRKEKERKISYIVTAITVEMGVDVGGRTLCQEEHHKEI